MISDVLQLGKKITVFPVIHGSGDFAIEVRRLMLEHTFDCLAVPLPPSFRDAVEQGVSRLPAVSAVVQPSGPTRFESDDDDDAVREFETLKELEKDMLAFQQQDLSNPEKQKQREKDMQKKQGVDAFKEAIDQFLLYDFFVILFILAWLVFGVGVRLGVYKQGLSYDEPVLGTWLFLWPFLFQPLLGVHMLATLVSPLIGKLKEKGILGEDAWQ